jgi:hypothetical protein
MKAFPPAEAGMVRYVLHLPKQQDESAFKAERIVGKTVQVVHLQQLGQPTRLHPERSDLSPYSPKGAELAAVITADCT